MRLTKTLSVVLIVMLLLTSCTPIRKEGIGNYDKATCSFGLTENLFPSDDFLDSYLFCDSDYRYWDAQDPVWGYAKAFVKLSYDTKTYEDAKAYCLESYSPLEKHTFTHNDYHFVEHLSYKSKDSSDAWVLTSLFPQHFNLFGYHDESQTLFFLGYYNGNTKSEEYILAQEDFSSFLNEVYSEFYDFSY